MFNLPQSRQDSGGSVVERAQFEHSLSTETDYTTVYETSNLVPCTILPPEVFGSKQSVNFTTDVWSFGILLWEMFTGGEDVNRHLDHLRAMSSQSLPFSRKLH